MGLNEATWNRYKSMVNKIHDQFNQDILIWRSWAPSVVDEFNEDKEETYTDTELKILLGYNVYRTWPMTNNQNSGGLDKQNMIALINVNYLKELGLTNQHNYLDFDPEKDMFIHRGVIYKGQGDTFIAQANNEPLLFQLILERQETEVGTERYNQDEGDPTAPFNFTDGTDY